MSKDYVQDASTIVKVGNTVHVYVKGVDDMGRIDLSMIPLNELRPETPRERSGGHPPFRPRR